MTRFYSLALAYGGPLDLIETQSASEDSPGLDPNAEE